MKIAEEFIDTKYPGVFGIDDWKKREAARMSQISYSVSGGEMLRNRHIVSDNSAALMHYPSAALEPTDSSDFKDNLRRKDLEKYIREYLNYARGL